MLSSMPCRLEQFKAAAIVRSSIQYTLVDVLIWLQDDALFSFSSFMQTGTVQGRNSLRERPLRHLHAKLATHSAVEARPEAHSTKVWDQYHLRTKYHSLGMRA